MEIFNCENQVSCEKFESCNFYYSVSLQNSCVMKEVTIGSDDFAVSSAQDETVGGLEFFENKNVSYLPTGISEKFPNLLAISATACSVKAIEAKNFKNLSKLKVLWLRANKIERISIGTFDDLIALELTDLRKSSEIFATHLFTYLLRF